MVQVELTKPASTVDWAMNSSQSAAAMLMAAEPAVAKDQTPVVCAIVIVPDRRRAILLHGDDEIAARPAALSHCPLALANPWLAPLKLGKICIARTAMNLPMTSLAPGATPPRNSNGRSK